MKNEEEEEVQLLLFSFLSVLRTSREQQKREAAAEVGRPDNQSPNGCQVSSSQRQTATF